ncbi:MAG: Entericidin EcnA/B family [Alphaproteobacteria bacterium]|jgi:predicted small secreted protein|nr:Entericidin EcnA/B family [Alphaproteobacteria bacterium]
MSVVMRKALPFALLLGIFVVQALALTACNTTQGFGKDVEKTGEAIQDGARDAKRDLK